MNRKWRVAGIPMIACRTFNVYFFNVCAYIMCFVRIYVFLCVCVCVCDISATVM